MGVIKNFLIYSSSYQEGSNEVDGGSLPLINLAVAKQWDYISLLWNRLGKVLFFYLPPVLTVLPFPIVKTVAVVSWLPSPKNLKSVFGKDSGNELVSP